jgi:hypothetical protein
MRPTEKKILRADNITMRHNIGLGLGLGLMISLGLGQRKDHMDHGHVQLEEVIVLRLVVNHSMIDINYNF